METRKLQKVGNGSYSLSLPKSWIIDNQLTEGDTLMIEYHPDISGLIISTNERIMQRNTISLRLSSTLKLKELIYTAYISNVQELTLQTKEFSQKQFNEINRILSALEGYVITDQSSNSITLSLIIDSKDFNLRKILKRMVFILQSSSDALLTNEKDIIISNEQTMNSLHHLSKKILIECVSNPQMKHENNLTLNSEVFIQYPIFSGLESLADLLGELSKQEKSDMQIVQKVIDYIQLISKLLLYNDKKVLTQLENDLYSSTINEQRSSILGRTKYICRHILENILSLETIKAFM